MTRIQARDFICAFRGAHGENGLNFQGVGNTIGAGHVRQHDIAKLNKRDGSGGVVHLAGEFAV